MAAKRDEYLELVKEYPLRPISSETGLKKAHKMIDRLLGRDRLSRPAQDYLVVLSDLVEGYEEEHFPVEPVSDAAMLKHLMEAHGITGKQLSEATGIVDSTVSNVLRGKRTLTREHIGLIADYFHVSVEVFLFRGASGAEPKKQHARKTA